MTHRRHGTDLINTLKAFSDSFLWTSTQSKETRKGILLPHLIHTVLSQEERELSEEMQLSTSELLD